MIKERFQKDKEIEDNVLYKLSLTDTVTNKCQ